MDHVSWMASMSMGMLFEDDLARKSFKSQCLLMRLCTFRLASNGLDELENCLQSAGIS